MVVMLYKCMGHNSGGKLMTNSPDLFKLRSALCEGILNRMDTSEMSQYIYDSLELSYDKYSIVEIKNEIEEQLGEDVLSDLMYTNVEGNEPAESIQNTSEIAPERVTQAPKIKSNKVTYEMEHTSEGC